MKWTQINLLKATDILQLENDVFLNILFRMIAIIFPFIIQEEELEQILEL